jgi:DNA gyrase subunit B
MGIPTGPLEQREPTDETGTTTRFWANDEIFETTHYSFETITNRFRRHVLQVEDELDVAVPDQGVNILAKRNVAFVEDHLAFDLENRDIADVTLHNVQGHSQRGTSACGSRADSPAL